MERGHLARNEKEEEAITEQVARNGRQGRGDGKGTLEKDSSEGGGV